MKKTTLIILIILAFVSCKKEKNTEIQETSKQVEVSENQQSLCEDAIIAIIESSNESKEEREGLLEFIKERGGSSYGYMMEACPNPKEEHLEKSEYYEFNFHASYPDRMGVISRYRFHPTKLILEKYDVVENSYFKIDFDESLLSKFKINCNF